MISIEPEYSYDAVKDIHSFNPMYAERPTRGRSRDKSTIVVKISRGITTIPVYSDEKPHDHIVELHSVETQTEDVATHGLKELVETIPDEIIIETDLITYADDHYEEKMPDDIESLIGEMLDCDLRQEGHIYGAMFDFDDREAKSPTEESGDVLIDYRGRTRTRD